MATSTTLKIPDALRQRIAKLAEQAGRTPHAFMIEALEAHANDVEMRRDLIASALAAEEEVATCGIAYSADEVHRYVRARVSGQPARRPKPTRS